MTESPGSARVDVSRDARAGRLSGWVRLCIAVASAVAVFAGLLVSNVAGSLGSQTVSNVGLCLAAVSAAVACLVRARRSRGRLRVSWGFIGLGILSWGVGQMAWVYLESVRGDEVPFPSAADVGYVGLPPLVVVGLLFLPVAAQSLANRFRSVLDGLMIGASVLLISWIFVVAPTIRAGGDSRLALYISLWYPLGDVVVVTVVLFQLALLRHRGRGMGRPLRLVGIGIGIFSVADSLFAYLNLTDSYTSGGVTDIFWFIGFAFILLAARMPSPAATEPQGAAESDGRLPFGTLLPYAAVLAALGTSVFWLSRPGAGDHFVPWTRSAIILLLVGRQLLTLLENRGLTLHLAARVVELSASERRFHALVQHSSDVVTVVDPGAVVLYQSESVRRVFGYPAATLTGRVLTGLLDAESGARLAQALRAVAGRPYATEVVELTVRHRDRRDRQAEMTVTNLLDDPSVGGLVLNTRDISERKELQEQLVHEAFHDTLTGLANRALFHEVVGEALRRRDAGTVTVLFLDLDGFKEVNDSLGHAAGDQLLVHVADRLRGAVRVGDVVARFGGDEFAVLMESAVSPNAEDIAERVVSAMDEPFILDRREIHIGASVGLACGGDDQLAADDAEQLMRDADLAMYRAKALGGGAWAQYDPQMHSGLVARLELEADLRRALDRKELALHYQPTIDLADGRIVGFEALVRWHHPVRGMVSPAEFIPAAEATGLILPLGRWVLTEACRQAVAWGARGGRPLKMAVNVSVRQFDRADLPAVVEQVLGETGMPAAQLCLEMTESVLMTDTEDNLAQLIRLKALGVQLAIDDFGTGYSSLAYLGRFPVDTIKIDRSFVERIGDETQESTLARTIVQLGQSLGMSTVAEGIEDAGQLSALRRMGCELAQGFYFSRPVAAAEAGRLLDDASAPLGAPVAA
jgi:diguanylate cyclase (GGDEF)-like protein/PAS domain S-box-containing protein